MTRGELYRVAGSTPGDPRRSRVFVVVSRQALIESRFATVVCSPVYSAYDGLSTQVPVGIEEGLRHDSSIFCDNLASIPKDRLTNYVGRLSIAKLVMLDRALRTALALPETGNDVPVPRAGGAFG